MAVAVRTADPYLLPFVRKALRGSRLFPDPPIFPKARFGPAVAVGTAIAGRPPHRSVRARLRIRLLPRMNGVEALIGIGMQDTRVRNPPVEQWVETIPAHLRALTATD